MVKLHRAWSASFTAVTTIVAAATAAVVATPASAATVDPAANYVFVSRHSGKAMDVFNTSTADGAAIVQWARNDGAWQQWQFVPVGSGYYQIRSRHSGKVLEIASGQDGATLTQQAASSVTRQHFRLAD